MSLGISNFLFEYCTLTLFRIYYMEGSYCRSNGSEKFNLMDPVSFLPEA